MLRHLFSRPPVVAPFFAAPTGSPIANTVACVRRQVMAIATRSFATQPPSREVPTIKNMQFPTDYHLDDSVFFHHKQGPRYTDYVKFKSPRKRVNILMDTITKESIQKDKDTKTSVWGTDFKVGDAIEIDYVCQGGIHGTELEKLRGVVLGRHNRGMDTAIYVRDVMYGEPVERKIPLHNPLVKSLKVLEKNFVFKGKRKIKRAKLYYLRERNPSEYRVTGVCKY